ncbi:MAG: hypothetical protein AB8I08_24570 [Sandaracinaceae bacterium]
MSRAGISMALALLASAAHVAEAQPAESTVRLEAEPCASLPFDPGRVSSLVALELELDGLTLVQEDAAILLRYAAVDCTPGVTRFTIEIQREAGAQTGHALLDEVALAAVPRALALHLVEMLREATAGGEGPFEEATQTSGPTATATPGSPAIAPPTSSTTTSSTTTSSTTTSSTTSTAPAASTPPTRSPFRLGATLHVRNTPDSGAFLGGARAVLDLGFGPDLPLAMRVDAGFALGMARADVTLGTVDAGVGLFLRAIAADILDLRFGPRLSVGHAFHIGDGVRRSEDVQVAVGLRVGGGVRIGQGVDLLLEAEVGANLVDLELDVAGQRSGLVGAYWSADVGVAFDL